MSKTDDIRARLLALKAELQALDAMSSEGRKPIELDQQSVGRLSRMDAIQGQAMAHATEASRLREIRRIESALKRLDDDEYGWCVSCGEEIAPARLNLDPAVPTCINCASGARQ